jgi:hypothetical protein
VETENCETGIIPGFWAYLHREFLCFFAGSSLGKSTELDAANRTVLYFGIDSVANGLLIASVPKQ